MPVPQGEIEFIASIQPALPDGEYVLTVAQQVKIDEEDKWKQRPSAKLQFSVAGPRFGVDQALIQSQFPPPNSMGEYYAVLPHIIFNRTTLPWERSTDNSTRSDTPQSRPWMALLLFDKKGDGGAPTETNLTVQDLLDTYGESGKPPDKPEFVKILKRGATPGPGELALEVGQHVNDRLTVIDVTKKLLWQIMPSSDEIAKLSHVRQGKDSTDSEVPEYPVVLCSRLPAPGSDAVGTQSIVHLVSLEARQPLIDELDALKTEPTDNKLVRLVSLTSWSFSTSQGKKTFTSWLKEAWCPNAQRTDPSDPKKPSTCAPGPLHTLRMPVSNNSEAERFLSQGYAPIKHQTRQGNYLISWYRSPLLPGQSPAPTDVTLPVRTSDQLVRYFSDDGMFDTTYAAAWELGRMLTLRSDKVSLDIFNWKRAHSLQLNQAEEAITHLPFAPDFSIAPDFPAQASQWFADLLYLKHVPFHYLVPREEMLPVNSLRFFHVDLNWLECLVDGAFSVGRVCKADLEQDGQARKDGHVPKPPVYSGFLLRSPVVSGWPNLGVEAYTQAIPPGEATDYLPTVPPAKRLRFSRLGDDILLCLFEGNILAVDIHEHADSIHFGVDIPDNTDPNNVDDYKKLLRNPDTGKIDKEVALAWKKGSNKKRTIDVADLALKGGAKNSAEFGVTMIEGVEKVRFLKQH